VKVQSELKTTVESAVIILQMEVENSVKYGMVQYTFDGVWKE